MILITYGTNSGSTLFASHELSAIFKENGHAVEVKKVKDVTIDELSAYDLVVFATHTWLHNNLQGQPHEWYFPFEVEFRKKTYPDKKFAILACGDSSYIEFCHSADYLLKMVNDAQGASVIDPLRIDAYYREELKNNERIREWGKKLIASL